MRHDRQDSITAVYDAAGKENYIYGAWGRPPVRFAAGAARRCARRRARAGTGTESGTRQRMPLREGWMSTS